MPSEHTPLSASDFPTIFVGAEVYPFPANDLAPFQYPGSAHLVELPSDCTPDTEPPDFVEAVETMEKEG